MAVRMTKTEVVFRRPFVLHGFDATEPAAMQGEKNLLVTGPEHPYASVFWKPGHVIGYEDVAVWMIAVSLWLRQN